MSMLTPYYYLSSPFDVLVDKIILNDDGSGEDLKSMQNIYDKVRDSKDATECFASMVRGLDNPKPRVVLKAINLLEFCVENCKKKFHGEITGGYFEHVFRTLLKKAVEQTQHEVANRLKSLLKRWAENEFKSDPEFVLIPAMYYRLKQEGVDFSNIPENSPKDNSSTSQLKDPNAKMSQQEVGNRAEDQRESQSQADKCESAKIVQQLIGPVTLNRDLFKDDESYNQYMIQFSMSKGSAVSLANDIVRLRGYNNKSLYERGVEKGATLAEKKHLTREKIYLILCFVIALCSWIW